MSVVGAILALGLVVFAVQTYQGKKEQEGRTALYQASKVLEDEIKTLSAAEKVDGAPFDVDAKLPKTVQEYKKITSTKVGSSQTLFEAAYQLGNLYLKHGQYQTANSVFKTAVAGASSPFQKASLWWLAGTSDEQRGAMKEANESYMSGLQVGFDGMKGQFMLALVRTFVQLNEKEKAKLYAEKLNQELPGIQATVDAQEMIK